MAYVSIPLLGILIGGSLFFAEEDTSYIGKTTEKIKAESDVEDTNTARTKSNVAGVLKEQSDYSLPNDVSRNRYGRSFDQQIKYKGKQLLVPDESGSPGESLPIGSNMVGRLLTAIDTRDPNQIVKVILPYGGKFKNTRIIERDTVLIGKVKYSGKGEKVFVQFEQGVLPSGKEFKLSAQALGARDYSSGLAGDYHSQADIRFLATVGLNMLSVGSDVLTEKEALSEASGPTPKATWKNAFYQGVSKGAEMEGQRQAEEMSSKQEYVTVDAGEDLIVNLTASLPLSQLK